MSDTGFDSYWEHSHSILEVENVKHDFPQYSGDKRRLQRVMHQIARRAWISATKRVHRNFDIVWSDRRWRIKGTVTETLKAKVRKRLPRTESVIEITHKPEFAGLERFEDISIGEVFEFDREYYKKLPYELSQTMKKGKPLGLAISLLDEGVYYFEARDDVLACDVRCSISYVHSRQASVLEENVA